VEGLVVSALQFKLEGELASTALLTIEMDVGKREYAYEKVMEIAKEKDFLVIDEV
jgi:ACT domain-containing protein